MFLTLPSPYLHISAFCTVSGMQYDEVLNMLRAAILPGKKIGAKWHVNTLALTIAAYEEAAEWQELLKVQQLHYHVA